MKRSSFEGSGTGSLLTRRAGVRQRMRDGAAAVEFAVVGPFLLALFLVTIEVGRAVMVAQIVVNASREGAREAALGGSTVSDVNDAVEEFLTNANLPTVAVTNSTVTVRHYNGTPPGGSDVTSWTTTTNMTGGSPNGPDQGDPVAVTVTIKFIDVCWLPVDFYKGGWGLGWDTDEEGLLTGTTIMRKEGS